MRLRRRVLIVIVIFGEDLVDRNRFGDLKGKGGIEE